jgi:inhibitor of KinA sporulation pathway (predicted exonuclease)
VIFNDYWTKNGNATAKEDWLEFVNAKVTGNAVFQNQWENFIITSKNHTPRRPGTSS